MSTSGIGSSMSSHGALHLQRRTRGEAGETDGASQANVLSLQLSSSQQTGIVQAPEGTAFPDGDAAVQASSNARNSLAALLGVSEVESASLWEALQAESGENGADSFDELLTQLAQTEKSGDIETAGQEAESHMQDKEKEAPPSASPSAYEKSASSFVDYESLFAEDRA